MSSRRFAAPLRLELGSSRRFALYLMAVHCAAIGAVLFAQLPLIGKSIASAIIFASLLHGLYHHAWRRHPHAVIGLLWDAQGEWRLEYRNGSAIIARLRDGCFCHPQLVVLNFRRPGFPWLISVPVFPDSLPADIFRRLRVRLKLEAGVTRTERYI